MKKLIESKKGKLITIVACAVVLVIILAIALSKNGYRSIVVEQTNGTVTVTGDKNNGNAYKGEKLFSGDKVSVGTDSDMVMCMDTDKYVYADEGTNFGIEASSAKEDSRLKIELSSGSELNELKSKLGPNDTYQVDTPNATMSVRGTTFRVTVYEYEGETYSLLEVTEGEVYVQLKNQDGTYNGEDGSFVAGQSAMIRGYSEFIVGDENEKILRLNYEILPQNANARVEELINNIQGNVIVGEAEAQEPQTEQDNKDDNNTASNADSDNKTTGADDTDNNDGSDEKHVHTPGEWVTVTEATCMNEGLERKSCTECKEVLESGAIPIKDHTPGEWTTYQIPTCTAKGAESQTCIYCNKVLANRDIPSPGHSYSDGVCTVCGESDPSYSQSSSGPAACSHDWYFNYGGLYDEWICSKCGAVVPGGPTQHP